MVKLNELWRESIQAVLIKAAINEESFSAELQIAVVDELRSLKNG